MANTIRGAVQDFMCWHTCVTVYVYICLYTHMCIYIYICIYAKCQQHMVKRGRDIYTEVDYLHI